MGQFQIVIWNKPCICIFIFIVNGRTASFWKLASKGKQYHLLNKQSFWKTALKVSCKLIFLMVLATYLHFKLLSLHFPPFMLNLSNWLEFIIYGCAAIQYSLSSSDPIPMKVCYIDERHFTSQNYISVSLYDIPNVFYVWSPYIFYSERFLVVQN